MRRPPSQPPELPGYTFVKLLGSGGFSDVFLYDQKLPKRRVAVKVLLTEELTAANRAAFVAEANLMAQLSAHPYIVTIYHADVASDARPYFVMEYCAGPSLAERYKSETFPVADAIRTGIRLSSAVATAHSAGILHRDIKPANVLSNDYGWPALTDFGISSAVDDDLLPINTTTLGGSAQDASSTTESQSVGMSVPWSPPEMFEEDPHPDVRSDVFSLAATIYTVLAGHTPFEVRGRSNSTLDLIGRIERGAVTPMTRDDIPRSLMAVLMKGMSSDRNDRFATAVDFARGLQRVELELGYAQTSIEVPNLAVSAPERSNEPDGADETRARSVATIQAQPSAPSAFTPPPSSPVPSADETQVRGAQKVVAQPERAASSASFNDPAPEETVVRKRVTDAPIAQPSAPAASEVQREKPSRTNKVGLWVSAAVVAAIAVAVTLSIVLGGVPEGVTSADPKTPSTPAGGSAIVTSVPSPELVGEPRLTGSTLTFELDSSELEDTDTFVWRISNRTSSEVVKPSADGVLELEDYSTGSVVCIEASILRGGKTSAVPLEVCYPE